MRVSTNQKGKDVMRTETEMLYEKKGQVTASVNAIIGLIVGIGVAVLVLIFVGALGGQTYELAADDMLNVNTSADYIQNETIRSSIQGGITSSFAALEQTGNYLPIIVLAVVIALVLALVLSFGGIGGATSRGGAL